MKTLILYGELAKRFGKFHRFKVKNAAEAIRALKANFRGFEKFMCEAHLHGLQFKVFVGGRSVKDYPEIHNPSGRTEIIRLVPVLVGSKSGILKTLIGVVLIAAAVVISVASSGALAGFASQSLGSLGAALVIGGIAQMLTKPPQKERPDKESHIFNGPVNTTVQGKAVPVGYGRLIIGSAVISGGIETHEVPA